MSKIYFVSDVHLGSSYHESPREIEQKLVSWLGYIAPDATAIYFLGDVFDYWFEYRYVVPRGFVRFLGKCASLSDRGVELHFLAGNHDLWMTDYLEQEIGATIHREPIVVDLLGKRFRLAHGDEEYRKESRAQNFLFLLFRSKLSRMLYAAIHPRWTVGLAQKLSLKSRRRGLDLATSAGGSVNEAHPYSLAELEKELLIKRSKEHRESMPEVDYYLYGHRHLLADYPLDSTRRVLILGDWLKYMSWAEWDGHSLALRTWGEGKSLPVI